MENSLLEVDFGKKSAEMEKLRAFQVSYALEDLEVGERFVIIAKYFWGWNTHEIAEATNTDTVQVACDLHNGLRKFSDAYNELNAGTLWLPEFKRTVGNLSEKQMLSLMKSWVDDATPPPGCVSRLMEAVRKEPKFPTAGVSKPEIPKSTRGNLLQFPEPKGT